MLQKIRGLGHPNTTRTNVINKQPFKATFSNNNSKRSIYQKCLQLMLTGLILYLSNYYEQSTQIQAENEINTLASGPDANNHHLSSLSKRQVSWLRWWSYDSISGKLL